MGGESDSGFEAGLVGAVVGGKYVVEKIIGRGGMGCVAVGTHAVLRQKVAIKFMLAHHLDNPSLTTRFLREAQLAARLQSDHVVRVHDVGQMESGVPYMVMEYLVGTSLGEELGEKTSLPCDVAVDYLLQALEAIAEAHALGVVHRDLKPDNLFLARRVGAGHNVKVLDFGISKSATDGEQDKHALTQTNALLGSPSYMSPEQIRASKFVDARSDIWSVGVILYQLVEGELPFSGSTIGEIFGKVQHVDPRPMTRAPEGFEPVVLRCLARSPEDRFPTVAHLADALSPFAPATAERSIQIIRELLVPHAPGTTASDGSVGVGRPYSSHPAPLPADAPSGETSALEAAASKAPPLAETRHEGAGRRRDSVGEEASSPSASTSEPALARAHTVAASSPAAVAVATSGTMPGVGARAPSSMSRRGAYAVALVVTGALTAAVVRSWGSSSSSPPASVVPAAASATSVVASPVPPEPTTPPAPVPAAAASTPAPVEPAPTSPQPPPSSPRPPAIRPPSTAHPAAKAAPPKPSTPAAPGEPDRGF